MFKAFNFKLKLDLLVIQQLARRLCKARSNIGSTAQVKKSQEERMS